MGAMKKAKLLWMDLEMTGLDPLKDRILEVAVIATDWDFEEIATYEAVIKVDPKLINQRMLKGPSAEFFDRYPEARDQLIAQNLEDGRSGRTIEKELLGFIDEHFGADAPVLLAGNSIHQDRRFIASEWKRLDARLHYRMLDVSAWKLVFEGKFGKRFTKPEEHRALSDIRGSIEELEYYLKDVEVK
jgi:oligoribonuclease